MTYNPVIARSKIKRNGERGTKPNTVCVMDK
jgi:hypothetical protein